MKMRGRTPGFTIVELLIVIVVIAILASVTIVAFNGVQQRSRDARRVADANSVRKALEIYKFQNGRYPLVNYTGLGAQGGWETSAREAEGQFLHELKNYGVAGGTPVDPVNNGIEDSTAATRSANHYSYNYYRYSAGYAGCDPARGAFYVFGIMNAEANNQGSVLESSPGFSCPSRNWANDFDWVVGGFEQ